MFLSMNQMKEIAVVRRNGLGDVLMTIPLILLCKMQAPNACLTLFIEESAVSLVPYLQGPDDVVVIPAEGGKYWNHLKAARNQYKKI